MTLADIYRPATASNARIYNIALVFTGSILLAVSAQISFFVPFSPVPVTAQTLVVLLLAAALGPRLGVLTMLTYYAEGLLHLPVFSHGGFGWAQFAGPTGGYLIAFLPATYLVGALCQRGHDRKLRTALPAMALGIATIFIGGLIWLAIWTTPQDALRMGLIPFIPGEMIKFTLAALILPTLWRLQRQA